MGSFWLNFVNLCLREQEPVHFEGTHTFFACFAWIPASSNISLIGVGDSCTRIILNPCPNSAWFLPELLHWRRKKLPHFRSHMLMKKSLAIFQLGCITMAWNMLGNWSGKEKKIYSPSPLLSSSMGVSWNRLLLAADGWAGSKAGS